MYRWILAALSGLFLLTACGGGSDDEALKARYEAYAIKATQAASPLSFHENRGLTASIARKRALGFGDPGGGATETITVEELLNWAEVTYPDFFPKGPTSESKTVGGVTYTLRFYASTENYLGVSTAGGVYIQGPTLTQNVTVQVGALNDFKCQVKPSLSSCQVVNAPTKAGEFFLSDDWSGFGPALVDGKITYLGAQDGGVAILPSDIEFLCWNSDRIGWGKLSDTKKRGCAVPGAGGMLQLLGMCNNDRGLPTIWTKDGRELWLGLNIAGGWEVKGNLAPKFIANGHIEYGKNGYKPATVSVVREADNTVTLVIDFGSDCLGGFGLDGKLAPLDPLQPLMFMLHSNGSGWGLGTDYPSTKAAWVQFNDVTASYQLRFTKMKCKDAGNVTVYRAKSVSADGTTVEYDPGADKFGAGWLAIGGDNPLWQAGAGATLAGSQIAWDQPLCKAG